MNKVIYLLLISFLCNKVQAQWAIQAISPQGYVSEIEFTSNLKGYIIAPEIIGKTENGGNTHFIYSIQRKLYHHHF